MRRRMLATLDASPDDVRACATELFALEPDGDALVGTLADATDPTTRLSISCTTDDHGGTLTTLEASSDLRVPYFTWFTGFLGWLAARRSLRHVAATLRARLAGEPAPEPPRRLPIFPPVPFTTDQAVRLAAIAAVAAIANFGGSLLTQNGDAVIRSFGENDQALGFALALARAGVLLSLLAAAASDRFGRRRMLLVCLGGIAAANALSAAAPTFEVFTGAQLCSRALVNAALVVASIAAVEEAPEGARAYAFSMFALALGLGFAVSVALLPLADVAGDGWRIAFALSALTALLLPRLARELHETQRFRQLAQKVPITRRMREVFDRQYGWRFALLGAAAFLINVFTAPSSQLTNRYLTKTHDFSNSQVAVFRSVTAGVPGILGIVAAGRLAETRGRRPVTIIGLLIASVFQIGFFLGDGALLWILPSISIVAAACAGLAVGTMDNELFPTETRGTSNGFILVCAVAGSALGLVVATSIKDAVGGLGNGIALCGIAPLIAALFIVPRLPETRARSLDDISPSEV